MFSHPEFPMIFIRLQLHLSGIDDLTYANQDHEQAVAQVRLCLSVEINFKARSKFYWIVLVNK